MNDDDKLVCNRFIDAANNCYYRNMPINTDFLDLYRQSLLNSILKEMPPVYRMEMGGYDLAERKLILFLPNKDFPYDLPYKIIKISPANLKFSEDLSHRDYLGAILNLGISRDKIGDLIIGENEVYLFCIDNICEFLLQNITKIKHTFVKTELVESADFNYVPQHEEIMGSIASLRLDAVIALGFKESRNHIISYIEEGKVAVNGRIITSNAFQLKENDLIRARGLGKIKFIRTITETKKGRLMVIIHKYI